MLNYVEYLNIPAKIAVILVVIFFVIQIIGELLEFKGKVVPEFIKVRKYFIRKGKEREAFNKMVVLLDEHQQMAETIEKANGLLADLDVHYNKDNLAKRDNWIKWVNDRASVYDSSIEKIAERIDDIFEALKDNTKMTEENFVQNSRDRIIDFANKVGDENVAVSKEEFNRIFKIHDKYEKFLEERNLANGEVDIAIRVIEESYKSHLKNHTFIENMRGYNTK